MRLRSPSVQACCLVVVVILAGCSGGTPTSEPVDTPNPTAQQTATTTGNSTLEVHFINVGQ
jgi:ABC-type uncharacterized transport system auxiliary subunit